MGRGTSSIRIHVGISDMDVDRTEQWHCKSPTVLMLLLVTLSLCRTRKMGDIFAYVGNSISLTNTLNLTCVQEAIPKEDQILKFHAMREFVHVQFNAFLPVGSIEAYGSLASNCHLPDSDVDLCVVFEGVEVNMLQLRCIMGCNGHA